MELLAGRGAELRTVTIWARTFLACLAGRVSPTYIALDRVAQVNAMKLTPDDIAEFKVIYLQEFGEELSDAEANEMASRVMRLYELLARPIPAGAMTTLENRGHLDTMKSNHANGEERELTSPNQPPSQATRRSYS
jgi:hypothetical protein